MIYGKLAQERQAPQANDASWLKKLLGKGAAKGAASSGSVMEVPIGSLGKDLRRSYRDFLGRRIAQPWDATKTVLEYIDMSHNTYVRADNRQQETDGEWYVQFMFSGCSGLAETSAELASHWASIWFAEEGADISEKFLKPFGFIPSGKADEWAAKSKFLPIGKLGYARFEGSETGGLNDEVDSAFEVDPAIYESIPEEQAEELLVQLNDKFSQLFEDGRCRCQLCSPEMDPNQVSRPLADYIN